jgi:hypothetical protein
MGAGDNGAGIKDRNMSGGALSDKNSEGKKIGTSLERRVVRGVRWGKSK